METEQTKPKRTKKPKKVPVSKLYPGSAEVAAATGWSVEVVRALAVVEGCPVVRGGRGRRFTSVEAFRAWFNGLSPYVQRSVPEIDRIQRAEVAQEICRLTWTIGEDAINRLIRAHTYAELAGMRDHWRNRNEEERGERAAREALSKRKPS